MNFQDFVIITTQKAKDDLFRSVRAMPEDKLTWKPEASSRSALDILAECALMGELFPYLLEYEDIESIGGQMENWNEERKKLLTIEDCEKSFDEKFQHSIDAIKNTPDQSLEDLIDFPFGEPGQKISIAEAMLSVYWQLVYHLGQINYIQTLYGDLEMH